MNKVRLGIIGYGNIGTAHCKNIFEGKVPNMQVSAICDISEARRAEASKNYPDVAVFDDADSVFKSGLCDAVIIAVPHYEHPQLVIKALDAGLNVITEKPAGVYTEQVMEMNKAAEKSDKLFGIMYNQRTNPMYAKIRDMVKSGELGHIKRVSWIITNWYRTQAYHDSGSWRSTWKTEGGGTLINQNPHQLDLWQWMFGMPDKITAFASFGKYYDIEVEDDVTAFFEYENGTTGTYITSTGESPGTNRLEIACDMGKIVVEGGKMVFFKNAVSEREFNKTNTNPFAVLENTKCEFDFGGTGEQHVGIFKNFADAILNGAQLLSPGAEGIKGLTISNAMHYSAWTGETVNVKEFPHDKFRKLLEEKIAASKVDKSNISQKVSDTSKSYTIS